MNRKRKRNEELGQKDDEKYMEKPQFKKYIRGSAAEIQAIDDKKLKSKLLYKEQLFKESALTAAKVEKWLLPSEGGYLEADANEKTYHFNQVDIIRNVDITSSRKAFDLKLPELGPYVVDYTASGKYLLFAGRKGHVSIISWKDSRLIMETQVKETIRDVKFLHNECFIAAAQKRYIYIYDKTGAEVHCLKNHVSPLKLEFLGRHFLLASMNKAGTLHYQDTSTGQVVAHHKTKLGRCGALRMNPYNAVLGLGHSNGTVTMWSPNMASPLVSMLCHHGPVNAIAFDSGGYYMASAGIDGKIKIWDARKFQQVHSYFAVNTPNTIDISQKGLLAVGFGPKVEIWRDALSTKQTKPYMKHHLLGGPYVEDLTFCPYEDVLGIGHAQGFSSILVPGSGEPNFDAYVANPFETKKQRREFEVHALLDKLQPEMIMLDPERIGTVQRPASENVRLKREMEREANDSVNGNAPEKKKTKGRNKSKKRQNRKQENIVTLKRSLIRERLKQEATNSDSHPKNQDLPRALARFGP